MRLVHVAASVVASLALACGAPATASGAESASGDEQVVAPISIAELEARPDCEWRSLPMRISFDCESATLASAEALSADALAATFEVIERDRTVRAVKVFGYYSPNQEPGREDLALARARVLADAIHARAGVIAVAEVLGAAPATTHPEPCVRDGSPAERRSVERFADLAVLRCSTGTRP